MAYASVASLIQTIDLFNYHHDDDSSISISPRFKDQITSLHKHTSFLQSFLEDGDPNRAKNWEETIRDVTDRAEEIIDLLVSDSLLKSSSRSKSELDYSFDELEEVTKEMESTAERVKGRGTKPKAGADAELMEIISLLCEGSPNRETISILGMAGMGKSTLARNAYNHPLVMKHFDVRVWITVGEEYGIQHLNRDIMRCINIESVFGRRYLIVLEDIWNVKILATLKREVTDNGNGSRILFTTSLSKSAYKSDHVHQMSLLDGDSAWNLLREKIFNGDPCPFQLEHYGKIISEGCRGHPLSIEVVSGILAADQTQATWEDVSENIKIAYEEDGVPIFQILSLSYTYLPHYLRHCLLYLGCSTKDNEKRVSKLIKLWVAEGFLTQSECKSFEEIGEEHVEALARRNLVSVSKRKSNGRIKSITVHDLVRDLLLRPAHKDNFFNNVGGCGRFDKLQSCRRVSSSYYNTHEFLEGSTIRTVILYGGVGVNQSIKNVRLLRILDMSGASDYDLPEQVFHLFHLRYLAFHSGFSVSEAISNLQNLQTLIIFSKYGRKLIKMPKGIWRMPQLRHLLSFFFYLPPLKQGEAENSALENLETLSRVVDFVCSRENLKMIPNVKKLNIYYTESFIEAVKDIELHNLISLHKLEILKIEMEWSSYVEKHNKMSFAFPPILKKLNLCCMKLQWEDMKIVASLPNLEVLKLRNHACVGETWETGEGGFSRLMYLKIEGSDLENWITKSNHFPKLKSLVLYSCLHLSDVPREIGEISTLQLMKLDGKNQSLVKSAKRIQEDRDLLQVLVLE